MRPIRLHLALSGLALVLAAPPAWAGATVRVAPESVVRGDEIALGDLATIDGDEDLARRLRQVRLGPAPPPGASQRIDPDYLRLRLSEPRLLPDQVRVVIADQVVVTRAFQVLTGAALVEAAIRQIQERLQATAPSEEPYAVTALSRPSDMRVAAGAMEIVAQLPAESPGTGALGASVTVKVDGRVQQTLPLSFRIGRHRTVAVAARALDAKSALGPGDWRLERRPSTEVPAAALAVIADATDLEAAQPIREGDVLTPALVRQRVLVKRGELVTLIVEGPGFRITSQGLAVTDARRGESLRVVNPVSKREALGKVEASGVVRVPFRGNDQ